MRIVNGKVFNGQQFVLGDVHIEGTQFAEYAPCSAADIDAAGCWVIPGLIDVHFHGAMGYDFCDAEDAGIAAIAAYEASRGVTSIVPTTMTLPHERLLKIVGAIAAHAQAQGQGQATCEAAHAQAQDAQAQAQVAQAARAQAASAACKTGSSAHRESAIVGINLEGPYISPAKVGAQNPAYVRGASVQEFEELQAAAQGLIKLVDLAPEEPGNLEFIREVAGQVRVSVAHTQATYEQAAAAFEAGARHLTHLFNAMPALHHRAPGPIAAGAEHAGVTPEIITDGVHVAPAMVRLAFRMFGPARMLLISDSLRACGLGDGEYELGGQVFHVEGNRATIENGSLAGSVSDVMACMVTAVQQMGVPLEHAVRAATENPARALGLAGRGAIKPGYVADAVVLDENLRIRQVVLRGKLLP